MAKTWEDTVIGYAEMRESARQTDGGTFLSILQKLEVLVNRQAEITWKAAFAAGRIMGGKDKESKFEKAYQAGKAACAQTHFKPDWKIKAKDIKEAEQEGYEADAQAVIDEIEQVKKPANWKERLLKIYFILESEDYIAIKAKFGVK